MQVRGWHWGAKRWLSVWALTYGVAAFSSPAHAVVTPAELASSEALREAPLIKNLRQLVPGAAVAYENGVAAMNSGDLEAAEKHLEQVHHEAPGFTAGTRRLCLVKGGLKKHSAALSLCREAAGDGSSRSLAALSFALTGFGDLTYKVSLHPAVGALELAETAVRKDPADVFAQRSLCLAARAAGDETKMRSCTKALERLDTMESASTMWLERGRMIVARVARRSEPDPVRLDEAAYAARKASTIRAGWIEPTFLLAEIAVLRNDVAALKSAVAKLNEAASEDVRTPRYDTYVALAVGDIARARRALARAEALGLDEETRTQLQQQIDDAEPVPAHWLPILGGVIVLSAGAMIFYQRRRFATRPREERR